MRESGVVQGLKSFINRLHPTLPLSSKESSRLLTALTSSFRDHLDEVHPRKADEAKIQPTTRAVENRSDSKLSRSHVHFSAAAADSHLSSILTNPLLSVVPARPKKLSLDAQDYANARLALHNGNPPIDLLEEYHDIGRATIPIAALCLQKLKDSIDRLPEELQMREIKKVQPGKRTFSWLWTSGFHDSALLFDNSNNLTKNVVHFMVIENHEQYVWDWIHLDDRAVEQPLMPQEPRQDTTRMPPNKYQWKGRLLAILTTMKMRPPLNPSKSADAAILVCLKAQELKSSASQRSSQDEHLSFLPIAWPINTLFYRYYRSPHSFNKTDPLLFDRFIDAMTTHYNHPMNAMLVAMLHTVHPSRPTGVPLLEYMRVALHSKNTNPIPSRLQEHILAKPVFLTGMLRAAVRLDQGGHTEGAAWMKATISGFFPAWDTFELKLERTRRELDTSDRKDFADDKDDIKTDGLPVPSFS